MPLALLLIIQRQDNQDDLTLGSGKPDAWHLRLTVEPLFATKLPGDDGVMVVVMMAMMMIMGIMMMMVRVLTHKECLYRDDLKTGDFEELEQLQSNCLNTSSLSPTF